MIFPIKFNERELLIMLFMNKSNDINYFYH